MTGPTAGAGNAPRPSDLRVYVHFPPGLDAAQFKERHARGEAIEYTPYDLHLAERPGVRVAFSASGEASPRRLQQIVNRRLHFAIDHAWRNRRAMAQSDVVWTMSESEAFAVAALMMLRLVPRRPIIGTAIWLFNNWPTLPRHTRALFRLLSRYVDVMTVHSAACLGTAKAARLASSVELNYFGIKDAAYPPLPPPARSDDAPIHVLAAGNDWTRDWRILLEALGNDERFVVSAWTQVLGPVDQERVANLRLPKPPNLAAIRQMYAEADVVLVPMVANVYSGITVALEAVAQQRPVISTATGGVPTYFDPSEVRFVPPGDAAALRAATLDARSPAFAAMQQRARQRFVRDDYTTCGMVERFLVISRRILRDLADQRPPAA